MALITGGACLGALGVFCQAGLRDEHFDPWFGGVLPVVLLASAVAESGQLLPNVAVAYPAALAAMLVMGLLMLVRISYGNTTLTGLCLTLVVVLIYGLAHNSIQAVVDVLRPHIGVLSVWHWVVAGAAIGLSCIAVVRLDILMLAESQAMLLGLSTTRMKLAVLVVGSGLALAACSFGAALPAVGWLSACAGRRLWPSHLPLGLVTSMVFASLATIVFHWAIGPWGRV